MVAPSEVKIRVRSNALDLKEFTVAQMRRVTGLNPASIHTELQRMKREGYLTSEPIKEKSGRGAPPHIYKLTSDPEKRLELSRQVEAFYTLPSPPAPPKPTSLHFEAAVKLVDRLAAGQVSEEERGEVLDKARYHLDFAMHEEGVGIRKDRATEIIGAHINYQRARVEGLRGRWTKAESFLDQACAVFESHGVEEQLEKISALSLSWIIRRQLDEAKKAETRSFTSAVQCLQKVINAIEDSKVASHPLGQLLTETSRWLRDSLQPKGPSGAKEELKSIGEGITAIPTPLRKPRPTLHLIPIVSRIAAGRPIPTEDGIEGYITADKLSINGIEYEFQLLEGRKGDKLRFDPEHLYFATPVKGDSMDQAGIHEGDYVIIMQPRFFPSMPYDGAVVAAVIPGIDREATLKRFQHRGNRIVLAPESSNPEHQPHVFTEERVEIVGLVVAMLKPREKE